MLRVVTPAVAEPVTVEDVKAHLRVTHAADDALIAAQITAAREHVEAFTGLALVAATYSWQPSAQGYAGWRPDLPLLPATVTEVSYYDGSVRVVADAADYRFDADRGQLTLGAWRAAIVSFTTAPVHVPEALKSAIKLRVQAEYEADPQDAERLRAAAGNIAWLWRRNLGV